MAEVDTSSYPKAPALPAQKSLLDQVGQFQQLEQGNVNLQRSGIALSQDKLKQINDQFGLMSQELSTLANDPSITKDQATKRLTTFANTFGFKPEVTNHMLTELNAAPDVKSFAQNALVRGMDTQQKVNNLYGSPSVYSQGQQDTPVNVSPMRGMTPTGLPIQRQIPPTQPVMGADNQPTLQGPTAPIAPPGVATLPGGRLPIQSNPVQTQRILPVGKGNLTNDGQVTGVSIQDQPVPNQQVQNRFPAPSGPAVGLPPGVGEAAQHAGVASGEQLAAERTKAASFQRDIFPLAHAIPALESLGTKGTGPGTETINNLKSFVLSNVPGIKESDFGVSSVKNFDLAKKYLTDFVNQNGNSGTNDKLAAAFAGNPSVHISNAAAVDVAKSALALRRMQQSKYLAYEDSGLPADQASKFFANGQITLPDKTTIPVGQLDPRAFGIDNMSDKSKKVLLDELNKNPREKALFDKSLQLANQHGYLAVK